MVSGKLFKIHSNHSCSKVKNWKLKLGIQNRYCATLSWKSIKPQDNPATFSGWYGHFLDRPETFQIVWKLSRSYRHSSRSSKLSLDYPDTFLNYPDTFRIVRKLSRSPWHISRSPGLCLDYLDTYLRLSRHCLDRTETFQIIHTLFRLSWLCF